MENAPGGCKKWFLFISEINNRCKKAGYTTSDAELHLLRSLYETPAAPAAPAPPIEHQYQQQLQYQQQQQLQYQQHAPEAPAAPALEHNQRRQYDANDIIEHHVKFIINNIKKDNVTEEDRAAFSSLFQMVMNGDSGSFTDLTTRLNGDDKQFTVAEGTDEEKMIEDFFDNASQCKFYSRLLRLRFRNHVFRETQTNRKIKFQI